MDEQYVTVSAARDYLRISKVKMSELLRYGVLPWESDPEDARQKLIPASAVRAYAEEQERKRKRRLTDPKALRVA